MSTYAIVDFTNLIHRCKHVSVNNDIVLKSGLALQIVFNSLRQVWRNYQADHIVICLEGGSWRKQYYPDYKAQRKVKQALRNKKEVEEDEFYFQTMQQMSDFLKLKTNVTVLQAKGAEADDFVARWIQLHPEDNHVILSGDEDFYQLLSNKVKIYDGVKQWTISHTQVLNEKGQTPFRQRTVVEKDPKTGKSVKKTKKFIVEPPNPEYELFKKIIRGDDSDNIVSAYPGVRESGSAKKPGILEAFVDRQSRGYEWNNFMLHEWEKIVGTNDDLSPIKKTVRVIDEFKFNEKLVDLTKQPQEIIDVMDAAIVEAVQKPPAKMVGVNFLRFADQMHLPNLVANPTDYAAYLSAGYKSA